MSDYMRDRLKRKQGLLPPLPTKKEKKPVKQISDKRAAEMKDAKAVQGEDDTMKEKWFNARRREMVAVCQCGCAMPSSKHDDKHFRNSICHIFPQRLFPSVQYHRLNWVERKFWATAGTSACHSIMDDTGMDKWKNMADFDDIKEKFHQLAPLLTDEERAQKFYTHLEKLVYNN